MLELLEPPDVIVVTDRMGMTRRDTELDWILVASEEFMLFALRARIAAAIRAEGEDGEVASLKSME